MYRVEGTKTDSGHKRPPPDIQNTSVGTHATFFTNVSEKMHGENFIASFTTLSVVICFFYGHSGDFCPTCLYFYYACGNIRHTEYGNNSHTIDFHTVL